MLVLTIILAGLAALGVVDTRPAAAQCLVRTDWPIYTVVRGDSLSRIARTYGTTTTILISANCLTNPNRIFPGQQLRVPPAPVIITPTPIIIPPTGIPSGYNIRVSVQSFERGFMLWRSDNGEVSVYSGLTSGTTSSFPSSSYTLLPDNPITAAPAGFIRPIFALGKVWGNYPDVRTALGWATANEVGYITTVTRLVSGFSFTLPDGNVVQVDRLRNWTRTFTVPPPTAIPPTAPAPIVTTTFAAYQPYEGGFMIWEANTQNVVTFYNNNSYTVYPVSTYGSLPDNPVLDATPIGRVRPVNAFGRVWGNFPAVRAAMGWGLAAEQGYTATFRTTSGAGWASTCFALPDGRLVQYTSAFATNWTFVGVCS